MVGQINRFVLDGGSAESYILILKGSRYRIYGKIVPRDHAKGY